MTRPLDIARRTPSPAPGSRARAPSTTGLAGESATAPVRSRPALVELGALVAAVQKWDPRKEPNREFRYLDLSSVGRATKRVGEPVTLYGADAPTRARQLVRSGDVLVSTVRPNLNAVARVSEGLDGATASTGFCVLRPRPAELDGRYLFHWLQTPQFVGEMVRLATGASYPAVSDNIVKSSRIPLPPIEEQRRIAAVLDAADALRVKRRETIAKLDALTQSIFIDMFGDPVTNPRGWDVRRLEEVSSGIYDCPHSTPKWTDDGLVCLRTPNLRRGMWDWSEVRYVSRTTFEDRTRRAQLETDDIVLSREGTVGIAAMVEPGTEMCMGQRLVQVRAVPEIIKPRVLLDTLLFLLAPQAIERVMTGSTARHLNVKELRQLAVMTPPAAQQDAYVSAANTAGAGRGMMAAHLDRLDTLFASLQQRAFRGEL